MPELIASLVQELARRHAQVCPRQVLGLRLGLYAGELLGIALPQLDKRLLLIAETDGCFLDGLSISTGCSPARRTLRIEDYGKTAATCVDTGSGRALRLSPRPGCRQTALAAAPGAEDSWHGQRQGYQHMPAAELFSVQAVALTLSIQQILGEPGVRTLCAVCGEEILNGREIHSGAAVLCRSCAGPAYYRPLLAPDNGPDRG